MRKLFALVVLALALGAGSAFADITTALDGVTSTATSVTYELSGYRVITVHVYSAAGAAGSTVVIEQSNSASGPWVDVTALNPISAPTATGVIWGTMAPAAYMRVRVSVYAAGTISAVVTRLTSGK